MLFNNFKRISAAILNPKWATERELLKMAHLLVRCVGISDLSRDFQLFVKSLTILRDKSGTKFLVLYMKECVRLTLAFLNHKDEPSQKGGVFVRRGNSGLPRVIPGTLRKIIWAYRLDGNTRGKLVTRTVLTIFRFYQVLQFAAVADFGTITSPFSGIAKSLPKEEIAIACDMMKPQMLGQLKWNVSESSGPNGPKATWFAGVDALAFMVHPREWISLVWFMVLTKRYLLLGWIVILQVAASPILPIILLLSNRSFYLGRLVVLKEGGGKRRIVAVTDWWTQIVFRPLHDALFSMLRRVPQDGTFDQWAPVENWVLPRLRLGATAYSFDLSAATDRLPIEFQRDVLARLYGPRFASAWARLLDRNWFFNNEPVRYAVGQPIGAYSSWGMLAFCHHVVVQIAAIRSGWCTLANRDGGPFGGHTHLSSMWFPYYAIVGDDLVIADEGVAREYRVIMQIIGVKINDAKSLVSEVGLLEFAKRWVKADRGELSGVSPALLLGTVRNPSLLAVLAVHLFDRDWLNFPAQLISMSDAARKILKIPRTLSSLLLATIVGPSGLLRSSLQVTDFSELWLQKITGSSRTSAVYLLIESFRRLVEKDIADKKETAVRNWEHFASTWWRQSLLDFGPRLSLVAGILSIPLMLVSPGFWVYCVCMYRGLEAGYSASLNLAGVLDPALSKEPGAITFDLLDFEDLASIDWKRRRSVRDQFRRSTELIEMVKVVFAEEISRSPTMAVVPYVEPNHVEEERDPFEFILENFHLYDDLASALSSTAPTETLWRLTPQKGK